MLWWRLWCIAPLGESLLMLGLPFELELELLVELVGTLSMPSKRPFPTLLGPPSRVWGLDCFDPNCRIGWLVRCHPR